PTVPASLRTRGRALPDVSAAAGAYLFEDVKLVDREGNTIAGSAPSFGFGLDPKNTRFNPIVLTAGHWATGPHEVVIDTGTATHHHYGLGDTIGASADGPRRSYTIVGIGKIPSVSIGGATLALLHPPTAPT